MFRSSLLWPFFRPAALQQRRIPELARAFAFFSERFREGIETLDRIDYSLCRVPSRNKRANVDREFDTFLRFSHGLKIATGEELSFIEKRERPDFAVETRAGQILGIEVGEHHSPRTGLMTRMRWRKYMRLSGKS